jgi:hypothetical protein
MIKNSKANPPRNQFTERWTIHWQDLLLLRDDPGPEDIIDEFVAVRLKKSSEERFFPPASGATPIPSTSVRDRCDAFAACCDSFFRGCELLLGGAPETARQIPLLGIPPLPFILALFCNRC